MRMSAYNIYNFVASRYKITLTLDGLTGRLNQSIN